MAPQLVRITLKGATSRHPIARLPFSIGRHSDNDVVLAVEWVSRHHTRIEADGESLIALDLESTHHTYINATQIERHCLTHGDVLRIGGEIAFVFLDHDDEAMVTTRVESLPTLCASPGSRPPQEAPSAGVPPVPAPGETPGLAAPALQEKTSKHIPAPGSGSVPAPPPPPPPSPTDKPQAHAGDRQGVSPGAPGSGTPIQAHHSLIIESPQGHGLATSFDEMVGPMLGQLKAIGAGDDLLRRLKTAIGRLRHETEVLIEVGEAITTELELDRVLELIVTHVLRATGAERGFLLLKDKTTSKLVTSVARGVHGDLDEKERSKLSTTICQRAIDAHHTVVSMDTSAEDAVTRSIIDYNIQSAIAAPLIARSEDLGVLYVDAHRSMRSFGAKDMDFFQALANQSAIAISNARQYVRLVAEKEELERKVQQLEVHINERERRRQVEEITESEYFQALADKAARIRKKF